MDDHSGHRQRLRDSFKKAGLDGMSEINALELLLFYAIPRQNTNNLAHALIKRFGSLPAVFEASLSELCTVEGVGESTAILINLIPQLVRKSLVSAKEKSPTIYGSAEAGDFLLPRYAFEKQEVAYLLSLDSKKHITGCDEVGRGAVNSVYLETRRIVETALRNNAVSVILAHNHPDSVALPSEDDVRTTKALFYALRLINVRLEDHLIFADSDFVSLRDSNLMNYEQ